LLVAIREVSNMTIAQSMSALSYPLFDEVWDFLLEHPGPESVIAFQPSDALNGRLDYLLDQNRLEDITTEERAELDEFLRINHVINMLKIRAHQRLQNT
jgi:hypothetical protein